MIDSYSFGKIVVNGTSFDQDIIILDDEVIPNWWRRSGHSLSIADLEKVIAAAPAVLVIGTGAMGMMKVPSETLDFLREKGIEPHPLKTKEACSKLNKLSKTGNVAAALHLTC